MSSPLDVPGEGLGCCVDLNPGFPLCFVAKQNEENIFTPAIALLDSISRSNDCQYFMTSD